MSDALLAKQKDHQLQEDTEIDIADMDAEAAAALAAGEEEAEAEEGEEEDDLALEAAVDEGGGATAKGVPHAAQPKGSRGPGGRGSTAPGSGVTSPAPAAAMVESGAGDVGGSGGAGKRTSGRAKAAAGGEPAGKRSRK